jgi:Glycosyltransferase
VLSRHLMTPLSRTSARHLLRFAHVAAVSRAVEAVLQRDLHGDRRRIHRLYGGIDIARFAPDPAAAAALRRELSWPADALVFGLVANMHAPRGKGHYEFLEAAAQLGGEFPQARFLLVGSGELAEPLLARAAEIGLGQRLARLRFTAQVEQAMRALDVLVHPAVSTEALGLVIWEAMACGLPVLASRLDGIPETFVDGEHGFLLPPGDVAALRGAMARLAADAALRARLGAAARRHVAAEHDLPAFGRRAAALYRQVLGQMAGQGGPA